MTKQQNRRKPGDPTYLRRKRKHGDVADPRGSTEVHREWGFHGLGLGAAGQRSAE